MTDYDFRIDLSVNLSVSSVAYSSKTFMAQSSFKSTRFLGQGLFVPQNQAPVLLFYTNDKRYTSYTFHCLLILEIN